jgi:hypothetical protein
MLNAETLTKHLTEREELYVVLLQAAKRLKVGSGKASTLGARVLKAVEKVADLSTNNGRKLDNAKLWLRAIQLEHPETKSLVNQAFSELEA